MRVPFRRSAGLLLAALVLALGLPAASVADHDDGIYELPSLAQWNKTHLNVLVVPPTHGQIFNPEGGVLNGSDPNELTPFNSYLRAIEDAITAWSHGVKTFGAEWLQEAYRVDVFVLGRDEVPPAVLTSPDILVVTDEEKGAVLGMAVRVTPCVVNMSKSHVVSFNYADMYNVTAQEFGHCLGLRHVGSQGGTDPTSDLKHPEHDVMNGFYTHWVGWPDTHLHCISNLNVVALEFVFSRLDRGLLPTSGASAVTHMPVDAYGTTCAPPPADWRRSVPDWKSVPADQVAPPPSSQITDPEFGSSISRKEFGEISGTAQASDTSVQLVDVALVRRVGEACHWWSDVDGRLVRDECDDPYWNDSTMVSGGWVFEITRKLPKGSYRAMSRASTQRSAEDSFEPGRNVIEFHLTK